MESINSTPTREQRAEIERHEVPVEVMDDALRWLADGLNEHPELLDDGAVSGE